VNTRFDDIEDQFQTDWAALPEERTVSFEDPAELLRVPTASRLDVFRSVKSERGWITVIAERLHRDRSAVKRDVDQLAQVGLVTMETKTLPGYGLMKETRTAAGVFRPEARAK
jgi:predicted transcriptional regulator